MWEKTKDLLYSFRNKLKNNEDYYLETYEDTDKKIKGRFYLKVGKWFIILPVLLLVIVILYKAIPAIIKLKMQTPEIQIEHTKTKNTDIVFSNDEMWKMQSEEKQKKLEQEITEVKTNVTDLKNTIENSFEALSENVEKSIETNKEIINNFANDINSKIDNTRNELQNVRNEHIINLEQLKQDLNNGIYEISNDTTRLDPNKLIQFNPQEANDDEETKKLNNEELFSLNKIDEYEYISISETSILNVNTLKEEIKEDEEVKEFSLIGGFAVGTLLTGGNFNTMSEGDNETIPVTLSIDTKLKTPNNEEMDLRECFVRGAGKADFTSKKALITLTNIQCSLIDTKGNSYKIDETIEGWLWDENGEYGVTGRLITQEGEIISKALPLAFMQTAMEILTNNSRKTTDKDGVISISGAGTSFGANASDTIIDKIGDKWMKYMDGLNPKVNLRPGRQLVVQFKGGEKLKIVKIDPADIGNFKKSLEQGDDYEE